MTLPQQGILLRIFVSENDMYNHVNLYEAIVLKAKELNLAGATVFRGIMGYQRGQEVRTAKILRLSENLPVVIEIVDTQANIDKILPFLDEVVTEGLVTTEKVNVFKYVRKQSE
ncbi:MAG: DUF190 domain-containing protein [Bacteroidales bacterium]|nr:DUF190 domain-containing protein [Bacteroidales bacterium]